MHEWPTNFSGVLFHDSGCGAISARKGNAGLLIFCKKNYIFLCSRKNLFQKNNDEWLTNVSMLFDKNVNFLESYKCLLYSFLVNNNHSIFLHCLSSFEIRPENDKRNTPITIFKLRPE